MTVPPTWILEPRDMSVSLGETVVLQCLARGFPPPTVTWKRESGK